MLAGLLSAAGPVVAQSPEQIDRLTQQWLDTDRQSVRLLAEWTSQKPLLDQRMALLAAEKQQLQEILKSSNGSQLGAEAKRAELLAAQADLEQQQQLFAQRLQRLGGKVSSLATLLPPPLVTAWADEQAS